jgi:hypothetical protein
MMLSRRLRLSATLAIVLTISLSGSVLFAQKDRDKDKKDNQEFISAEAVLWREPADLATRDLFLGPGGEAGRPNLSNVTFIKVNTGGYSTKWDVRDGSGRKWVIKLGNEARPETAAVRLVWAVGYVTEINYLAPCVHIKGAPKQPKKEDSCEGDGFADVRFEARPENVKRLADWPWAANPFAGKKELNGLIVLMALLNNWDLKDSNNKVLQVTAADGRVERHYVISDLGATFGKTGGFLSRNRDKPESYIKTKFVEGIEHGTVRFAYHGKKGDLLENVRVSDAKWIGNLLAQLSDEQIQDAFRAANFTPEEIRMLTESVKARINQLVNLPG